MNEPIIVQAGEIHRGRGNKKNHKRPVVDRHNIPSKKRTNWSSIIGNPGVAGKYEIHSGRKKK